MNRRMRSPKDTIRAREMFLVFVWIVLPIMLWLQSCIVEAAEIQYNPSDSPIALKPMEQAIQQALWQHSSRYDVDAKDVHALFQGLSPADIERVVRRAIKRMILRNQEFLGMKELVQAKDRELRSRH